VLIFGLVFCDSIASQTDWNRQLRSPFEFYFMDEDRLYVDELFTIINIAYEDLSREMGIAVTAPVNIYLAPSEEVFNHLTGNFIPDWGAGVADPDRNLIILKSPGISENYDRFPKLIRHELIHIMVGQNMPRMAEIPKWFSEGIALLFSRDEEFAAGEAISKALISDSIIPLDEIDDVLKFHRTKARLAYEESHSFLLFLQEKYGTDRLIRWIRVLKSNPNVTFDHSFQAIYDEDLFDVEMLWYEYLEKKYRWHFLLDFDTYLWIFILLLFILVFLAIKYRNRKIIKSWEDEERLANF
jgi:hypothetical protein